MIDAMPFWGRRYAPAIRCAHEEGCLHTSQPRDRVASSGNHSTWYPRAPAARADRRSRRPGLWACAVVVVVVGGGLLAPKLMRHHLRDRTPWITIACKVLDGFVRASKSYRNSLTQICSTHHTSQYLCLAPY